MYKFHCLKRPLHSIKVMCTETLSEKFRMAKNGCSEFSLTIFPKKTGINSERPKMAIPNFSNNFSQKDWYKFRMAKNGHSEFCPTIFSKKTGINLEWPKMAILNFFQKKTGINSEWPKMAVPNFF